MKFSKKQWERCKQFRTGFLGFEPQIQVVEISYGKKKPGACTSPCHWGTLLGFFFFQCPTLNGTEQVSFRTRESLSDLFTQQKFWLVEALGKRGGEE